jgi:hypothetical protein
MSDTKHSEDFLAELADSAYRVALRHGFKGSFLQVELGIWNALREVFAKEAGNPNAPALGESDDQESFEEADRTGPMCFA